MKRETVRFTALIRKFGKKGEKSGWSYIEITPDQAELLNPGIKTSFRVKGQLDQVAVSQAALLPMGDGVFILPLKSELRTKLRKQAGSTLQAEFQLDESPLQEDPDFISCLEDSEKALEYFRSLPRSHQLYFSKWIGSAKTDATKVKRVTKAVLALERKMSFSEMLREGKK